MRLATTAVAVSRALTPANVTTSVGLTPNRRLEMSRVSAQGGHDADEHTGDGDAHCAGNHRSHERPGRSTECDAHSELVRPLPDEI